MLAEGAAPVLLQARLLSAEVRLSMLTSFPEGGIAVVVGAHGGIGRAFLATLARDRGFAQSIGLARHTTPPIDLLDEATIAASAGHVGSLSQPVRLVIDATGFLHNDRFQPEKSWRQLDAAHMGHAFAINAAGPALLMKHFLPLLPREGKAVFATLSAKVGSIADNELGGWWSYRAAKAALNQFVRTASIELARKRPQALCVALHPGTVDTGLSGPFAKTGLDVQTPEQSVTNLLGVLDRLGPADTGGLFTYAGDRLPW